MAKRSFDRSTPAESSIIDMHTGKPVSVEAVPIICERIRHYRELLGYEQKTLANKVGITANAICNWERGRSRPDVNLLPDICKALNITLYQLFDIQDPTVKYTAGEEKLIEDYRKLTPTHQYAVTTLTQNLIQAQEDKPCDLEKLVFFDHALAAGIDDWTDMDDIGEPIYVHQDSLTERADYVFTVNGDSMEPEYGNGCMVLVKRIDSKYDMQPGEVGAFMVDSANYIKVYQTDGLHSYNTAYPVMPFDQYDNVYLIGKVIGILYEDDIATEKEIKRYKKLHPEER